MNRRRFLRHLTATTTLAAAGTRSLVLGAETSATTTRHALRADLIVAGGGLSGCAAA